MPYGMEMAMEGVTGSGSLLIPTMIPAFTVRCEEMPSLNSANGNQFNGYRTHIINPSYGGNMTFMEFNGGKERILKEWNRENLIDGTSQRVYTFMNNMYVNDVLKKTSNNFGSKIKIFSSANVQIGEIHGTSFNIYNPINVNSMDIGITAPCVLENIPTSSNFKYTSMMGFITFRSNKLIYSENNLFLNAVERLFLQDGYQLQYNIEGITCDITLITNITTKQSLFGGILTNGENEYEGIIRDYDGNPISIGGNSGTGGGKGDFDEIGDDIDFPENNGLTSLSTGFTTIYAPNTTQLNKLSAYMWSSEIFDTLKKMYSNPIDVILGLHILPVFPPISGSSTVSLGGVSTGVSMAKVSAQYTDVHCGEIEIKEFWGSALDYSPYTKIQIYLPYIGTRTLNVDDIMNKKIEVRYRVDVLTGSLVVFIKSGGSVLYQFSGNCSSAIPITGRDFSQIIQSAISTAVTVGSTVATGGSTAPLSAGMALSGVLTTAGNVMNSKPQVQKSGGMGGTGGLMGEQTPYLIIERPRQSLPVDYMKFVGYPSNITSKLSALKGYTEIESVHLEGVTATDNEKTEILTLLKSGVII